MPWWHDASAPRCCGGFGKRKSSAAGPTTVTVLAGLEPRPLGEPDAAAWMGCRGARVSCSVGLAPTSDSSAATPAEDDESSGPAVARGPARSPARPSPLWTAKLSLSSSTRRIPASHRVASSTEAAPLEPVGGGSGTVGWLATSGAQGPCAAGLRPGTAAAARHAAAVGEGTGAAAAARPGGGRGAGADPCGAKVGAPVGAPAAPGRGVAGGPRRKGAGMASTAAAVGARRAALALDAKAASDRRTAAESIRSSSASMTPFLSQYCDGSASRSSSIPPSTSSLRDWSTLLAASRSV